MQNYLRRGYFPGDAESPYERWRVAAVLDTPEMNKHDFEALVKVIWLAGWHTRGQVAYGIPDEPDKTA